MKARTIGYWITTGLVALAFAAGGAVEVRVAAEGGRVTLSGATSTDEMLAFVEVASAVPGVRDVAYRTEPGEEVRPRFH